MKDLHALQIYRIEQSLWQRDRKGLDLALSNKGTVAFCIDVHPVARIGARVMLDHVSGIANGKTAIVDDNVSILQDVTSGRTGNERGNRHPKVRCGAMTVASKYILGKVEIGEMRKIAAGNVVPEAVPIRCTVDGVPARIVQQHQHSCLPVRNKRQPVKRANENVWIEMGFPTECF